MASSALMVSGSFDRLRGSADNTQYQSVQQFQVKTENAPIIQGQINTIRISELTFPYSTPTVIADDSNPNSDNSFLYLARISLTYGAGGTTLAINLTAPLNPIRIPTGFYNGTEMAAAIQAAIAPFVGAELTCAFDDKNNRIYFTNTTTWDPTDGVVNPIYILNPFGGRIILTDPNVALQQPELEWTIGLRSLAAKFPPQVILSAGPNQVKYCLAVTPLNYPNTPGDIISGGGIPGNYRPVFRAGSYSNVLYGSPYSGRYTDYVDIVSTSLCSAQYVRDGNTNQNIVKKDIIARVYIADEVSLAGNFDTGSRPFLIHRQFANPKYLRWTVERSVDTISLELFDQFGNPLPVSYPIAWDGTFVAPVVGEQSDYAVTFLVAEYSRKDTQQNVGYTY